MGANNSGDFEMRNFRTATILLATPLLLMACNKPAAPAADATENTAMTEATDNAMGTGNAMDTGMAADVNNSGVPELTSSGPGIITKSSNLEEAPAAAPAPTSAPTK